MSGLGLSQLKSDCMSPASMPRPSEDRARRTSEYVTAILEKDRGKAEVLVEDMITQGFAMSDIFEVLGEAEVEVGDLWEKGIMTVSEEHSATDTTLACISLAAERLRKPGRKSSGLACLCTAEGELHGIGVSMLSELLMDDGWQAEVGEPGTPMSQAVERLKAAGRRVDLFILSATMKSSLPRLKEATRMIRADSFFKSSRIMIGGPAFKDREAWEPFEDPADAGLVDCVALSLPEALEFSRLTRPLK